MQNGYVRLEGFGYLYATFGILYLIIYVTINNQWRFSESGLIISLWFLDIYVFWRYLGRGLRLLG